MAMEGRGGGYSLLELLMTLVIITMLATLSTSFNSLVQRERSIQAIMDLRGLLAFARQSAIIRQKQVTLCALNESQACTRHWHGRTYAVFIDHDKNRALDKDDEVLRVGFWSAERGTLIWRASLARPYIIFKLWGETAQNGSFFHCPVDRGARNATAIIVNRAGRNYIAQDRNRDGIAENASGRALSCD